MRAKGRAAWMQRRIPGSETEFNAETEGQARSCWVPRRRRRCLGAIKAEARSRNDGHRIGD